jgi:hypothetical protein
MVRLHDYDAISDRGALAARVNGLAQLKLSLTTNSALRPKFPFSSCDFYRLNGTVPLANRKNTGEQMGDPLARARRFRSRTQEFRQLADTCGSAQHAKHYYLIAKHLLALAYLDEQEVLPSCKDNAPQSGSEHAGLFVNHSTSDLR